MASVGIMKNTQKQKSVVLVRGERGFGQPIWVIVMDKLLLFSYQNGNLHLRASMAGWEKLAKSQGASGRRRLVEIE